MLYLRINIADIHGPLNRLSILALLGTCVAAASRGVSRALWRHWADQRAAAGRSQQAVSWVEAHLLLCRVQEGASPPRAGVKGQLSGGELAASSGCPGYLSARLRVRSPASAESSDVQHVGDQQEERSTPRASACASGTGWLRYGWK